MVGWAAMIIALLIAVTATLVALLRGGSLDNLANTELRWLPLLFAALIVQAAVDFSDPSWLDDSAGLAVLLITNLAVVAFLALNRHLPGMQLAALGLFLNVVVIAANGAMPVSESAAATVGLADKLQDPGVKHEVLDSDTNLGFLGDIIPVPVLNKLISVGDVVLAAGIGVLAYRRTLGERSDAREPATSG